MRPDPPLYPFLVDKAKVKLKRVIDMAKDRITSEAGNHEI